MSRMAVRVAWVSSGAWAFVRISMLAARLSDFGSSLRILLKKARAHAVAARL